MLFVDKLVHRAMVRGSMTPIEEEIEQQKRKNKLDCENTDARHRPGEIDRRFDHRENKVDAAELHRRVRTM